MAREIFCVSQSICLLAANLFYQASNSPTLQTNFTFKVGPTNLKETSFPLSSYQQENNIWRLNLNPKMICLQW